MIFLVCAGVLAVCILISIFAKKVEGVWPFVIGSIAAVMMFVTAVFPSMMTPTGGNGEPDTNLGSSSLIALGHSSETSGSFFLGTGTVDEEQVYVYMADTDLGAEMLTVPVYRARIVEEKGEPHIEHWAKCDMSLVVPWPACSRALLVFHIPPGSITRDFTIAP